MTEEELSKAAMTERYPESNMSYDWLTWYKLRDVYRDFKTGRIGKSEGEAQKKSIFLSHKKAIDEYNQRRKVDLHFADFWRKIEEVGTVYRKDPTIANADRFLEAVYGVGRLDRTEREETKNERD